jgi:hypothetical protein
MAQPMRLSHAFASSRLGVRHHRERRVGHDRVTGADVELLAHVPVARRADVEVHVLDLEHLLAVLVAQLVRRLAADHTQHVAASRLDDEALTQHDVAPPAAERQEADEALLAHVAHHEADLVEVTGQHDARPLGVADLLAHEAAEPVLREGSDVGEVTSQDLRDLLLVAGHAVRVGQLLQELQGAVHDRVLSSGSAAGPVQCVTPWLPASARAMSSMRATNCS